MMIMQWIALAAMVICITSLVAYFVKLVKLGAPHDLSEKSGNVNKGIAYSNTVAMMPNNKESAYLHLPGYAMGILFHLGTFLSFLLFVFSFFNFYRQWLLNDACLHYIIVAFLLISAICGFLLFMKRVIKKDLKNLTNPDDYLSNLFTTLFHVTSLLFLLFPQSNAIIIVYYIVVSILFLYMPIGKLRHVVYYFAARYHLGFFYGWRNVWPKKN